MIRVTVELVPGGVDEPRHLGTMLISNQTGVGRARVADYLVRMINRRGTETLRGGVVRGHHRLSEPVWVLVRKALQEAGY